MWWRGSIQYFFFFCLWVADGTNISKHFRSGFKYAVWPVTGVKQHDFYSLPRFLQRPGLSGKFKKALKRYIGRESIFENSAVFPPLASESIKVPHRILDMCSSDFENSHVFAVLADTSSKMMFYSRHYSKSFLVHVYLKFFIAKVANRWIYNFET